MMLPSPSSSPSPSPSFHFAFSYFIFGEPKNPPLEREEARASGSRPRRPAGGARTPLGVAQPRVPTRPRAPWAAPRARRREWPSGRPTVRVAGAAAGQVRLRAEARPPEPSRRPAPTHRGWGPAPWRPRPGCLRPSSRARRAPSWRIRKRGRPALPGALGIPRGGETPPPPVHPKTRRRRLAAGRPAWQLSRGSEAGAGQPGPAKRVQSRPYRELLAAFFFARGLLKVRPCYKHRVSKERVEGKGIRHLLPPGELPSPLENPGPWAEGDKLKGAKAKGTFSPV